MTCAWPWNWLAPALGEQFHISKGCRASGSEACARRNHSSPHACAEGTRLRSHSGLFGRLLVILAIAEAGLCWLKAEARSGISGRAHEQGEQLLLRKGEGVVVLEKKQAVEAGDLEEIGCAYSVLVLHPVRNGNKTRHVVMTDGADTRRGAATLVVGWAAAKGASVPSKSVFGREFRPAAEVAAFPCSAREG